MKNEKVEVKKVSREVIEKKLLSSLDDGAHVAIVLGKKELDSLIDALYITVDEGFKEYAQQLGDLEQLRKEAFGT